MSNPQPGDILPTHSCFDDAALIVLQLVGQNCDVRRTVRIVHAICLFPGDDQPYSHAWVEHEGNALFMGIFNGQTVTLQAKRKEYRKKIRIVEATEYTVEDMLRHIRLLGPPPWKPEYKALCNDVASKRKIGKL